MSELPAAEPDLEALLDELKARVQERRRSGYYPPGLEEDLSRHFRHLTGHRAPPTMDEVPDLFSQLHAKAGVDLNRRAAVDSKVPGGSALHAAVGKLVARHVGAGLEQVNGFQMELMHLLGAIISSIEELQSYVRSDVQSRIDLIIDRIAAYESVPVDSHEGALRELARKVDQLLGEDQARSGRHVAGRTDVWPLDDQEERKRDFEDLATELGSGRVVVLGAEDGAVLEALATEGRELIGIEDDPAMIVLAQEHGVEVVRGDPLVYLEGEMSDTLAGVVVPSRLEVLPIGTVAQLVIGAHARLLSGGKLMVRALDPTDSHASAVAMSMAVEAVRLYHPKLLASMLEQQGFSKVQLLDRPRGSRNYVLVGTK